MKRLLSLLSLLAVALTATAQIEHSIVLDSNTFRVVQTDALTGVSVDPIGMDSSRQPCARVKIFFHRMTSEQIAELEPVFPSGTIDCTKCKVADGNTVLILEFTAKPRAKFYLKHPTFGTSNEVEFNFEGGKEYQLEATLNQTFSIVINSNEPNVDIYLDDLFKGQTDTYKSLTIKDVMIGGHKLKVVYGSVSYEQEIDVNSGSIFFRQDVNKAVKEPQFVVFEVEPKSAVVTINNTPYSLTEGSMMTVLENGSYNYVVAAAGYNSQSGTFAVAGQKVEKVITLTADAAKVTLTAPNDAEIWVNGSKKGSGSWSGTLNSGVYIFEARKAGHRPATMSQKITSDNPTQSYTLPAPTPMVGSVSVVSTPLMADVTLDGKPVGRTPIDIPNLLVGNHTLKISKSGYETKTQTITISEGKTTTVSPTLTKQQTSASASASGTYNIGDLVSINGVQGIVFQTSPVVKIVSVKEGFTKWSEYGVTNATDKDNGKANMDKIKAISGWQTNYPPFKWCADYGNGWYLPAINELKAIYVQRDKINKTLSANNMDRLGTKDGYLWSSSEYDSIGAYYVNFSIGTYGHLSKGNNFAVRAVLALE